MHQLINSSAFSRICLIAILGGFAIFGFAIGVLMSPPTEIIGMDRLSELTCLQMAGTPDRAVAVLLGFDEAQLAALQQLLVPGDIIFAWGYGLVFFGVLGLLTARLSGRWQRVGAVIMWAPLLASLFDVFEDIGLHRMVTTVAEGGTGILPAVVLLTTISASLKYLFLAVVAPAYGVAGAVKAFKTDRRLRSIGLYVFVVLVAFSMMQKPFSEIPACF